MLKKTLIAAAATALLAVGSTAASASGPHHGPGQVQGGIYFGGPGWSIGFGAPGFHRFPPPRRVCKPVFKRINYRHHGRLKTRVIKVGQRCHLVRPPPRAGQWHPPGPGWGPGPGPAWGFGPGPRPGPGPGRGFGR